MSARRCIVCNKPLPEPVHPAQRTHPGDCRRAARSARDSARHHRRKLGASKRDPGPAPGSTPAPCERDAAMLLHRQARALLAPLNTLVLAQRRGERMRGFFR